MDSIKLNQTREGHPYRYRYRYRDKDKDNSVYDYDNYLLYLYITEYPAVPIAVGLRG